MLKSRKLYYIYFTPQKLYICFVSGDVIKLNFKKKLEEMKAVDPVALQVSIISEKTKPLPTTNVFLPNPEQVADKMVPKNDVKTSDSGVLVNSDKLLNGHSETLRNGHGDIVSPKHFKTDGGEDQVIRTSLTLGLMNGSYKGEDELSNEKHSLESLADIDLPALNGNCITPPTNIPRLQDFETFHGDSGMESAASSWDRTVAEVKEHAFTRLQEELRKAHQELKLKDEEVTRLSRIRSEVEAELEELTASLFQVSLYSGYYFILCL